MSDLTLWIIACVAFAFGAFYSGSETAFIAANRIRLQHLAGNGNRRAMLVLRFLDEPEYLLSAVLVGTNLAVIGCTATFTAIATRHFGDSGATVATLILVPLFLLFNEIIPKGLFLYYANRAALGSVHFLRVLTMILYPVVKTLSTATDLLTRMLPTKASSRQLNVTMEELLFHLGDSRDAGLISAETTVLAERAVELKELKARDVMVPLEDVVMIDYNASFDTYVRTFIDAGFSRMPIYDGNRGNVVGVLSVHELMKWRDRTGIRQNLKPPYSISPDTPIVDVFFRMKEHGRHMAMIHDDNEVIGMTTMEDILERFVGAIADEFN